jgi:hypothetical protein
MLARRLQLALEAHARLRHSVALAKYRPPAWYIDGAQPHQVVARSKHCNDFSLAAAVLATCWQQHSDFYVSASGFLTTSSAFARLAQAASRRLVVIGETEDQAA